MINELPSIAEAVRRIHRGDLSPVELLEYCLERIDRWDDQVGAWQTVDARQALYEAEQRAVEVHEFSRLPPLYGIPVGVKDIIDVAGLPTRGGWSHSPDRPARQDAPAVQRLRQAGAIILGKTTTTELACFDPSRTRNPWNLSHTPGGSSSGSAAAVALQMCMGALGSQTGGSIIRPAAYCGVCGLKPWFGRVSTEGVMPVSESLDHVGPLASSVPDVTAMWEALAPNDTEEAEVIENGTDLTVGAPLLAIIDEAFEHCENGLGAMTQAAIDRLREAGAQSIQVRLPRLFGEVLEMHRRLMAVDVAASYGDAFRADPASFGPSVTTLIEEGLQVTAVAYVRAQRARREFQDQLRRIVPPTVTLIGPATVTTAPASLDTTGDPKFNSPWSFGGLPACTLPIGLSGQGLPCGLQLVGAGSEWELLKWAAWCERHLDFHERPTLVSQG